MKNNKKLIIALLSLGLIFTACSNKEEKQETNKTNVSSNDKNSNEKKSNIDKKDQGEVVDGSINSEILKQNWKYQIQKMYLIK
ncbi:MAG: hypothetical protein E6696_05050 [Anaerococcus hydrogenalis]|nr:hypothetical protein [Anaerococcus hydrogenalis]